MKTKLFFKHFCINLLQIFSIFAVMAVFGAVAKYVIGIDPIWGLLAFLITMFGYFVIQRSLEQSDRELNDF